MRGIKENVVKPIADAASPLAMLALLAIGIVVAVKHA
jgi:hypothetical protein